MQQSHLLLLNITTSTKQRQVYFNRNKDRNMPQRKCCKNIIAPYAKTIAEKVSEFPNVQQSKFPDCLALI